jgi:hypothetical protein
MLNDYTLTEYCNDIAQEICRDASDVDQAMDWASESADGSQYAIYYAKAHELCRGCDTTQGEDFVADCFSDVPMTYDEMACRIAYGEIDARIRAAVYEIFEQRDDAA